MDLVRLFSERIRSARQDIMLGNGRTLRGYFNVAGFNEVQCNDTVTGIVNTVSIFFVF